MEEIDVHVAGKVVEKRTEAGLTRAQLAAVVSCRSEEISAIEEDKKRVSPELLVAIADALGVNFVEFFLGFERTAGAPSRVSGYNNCSIIPFQQRTHSRRGSD